MSFGSQNPPSEGLTPNFPLISDASVDEVGFLDSTRNIKADASKSGSYRSGSASHLLINTPPTSVPIPAYHPNDDRDIFPKDKTQHSPPIFRTTGDLQNLPQDHVQFATYPGYMCADSKSQSSPLSPTPVDRVWVPHPLRPYFWITFVFSAIFAAIGLEVALHFSNRNKGWPSRETGKASLILHYVYTLPPVASASLFVALWAWTDIEIKKIQPYVDLVYGDSPPHRSILLDYTRHNNLVVWVRAAANRHYLVTLASLMVILASSLQPLAAALLNVRSTWWQEPDITMTNLAAIGLNHNPQFHDLTTFLTATGYAGASVLYDIGPPSFIRPPYTIAPFELPVSVAKNGTVFANSTAIKSDPGCQPVQVQMKKGTDGSWLNTVTFNGCSITWDILNSSSVLFGTDAPACNTSPPPQFSPIIFWIFSYRPTPQASAAFCYPSISLWEVNVGIDIATGKVTSVMELRPFSSKSPFSSFSSNITGPPLNGRAYNGIKFNLTNPSNSVLSRQTATQLQLPAAIYQAAVQSPEGFASTFENNTFVTLSDRVYGMYLSVIASQVYLVPDNEPIRVQVKTFRNRVWLSDIAVHLLTAVMLLLALCATIVHFFHQEGRRHLRLKHEPGTIASAVSIGARTGVGEILAGRHHEKEIKEALQNKRFRIDPITMKIIMEGEYGYESATSPKSRSVFEMMQGQRANRISTKSVGSKTPASPESPGQGKLPRTC